MQGQVSDTAVRNVTHSVMVAWAELATKTSVAPANVQEPAPQTSLQRHEASAASGALLPSMHGASSAIAFSNLSRIQSPSVYGDADGAEYGSASCSRQAGNDSGLQAISTRSSPPSAAGIGRSKVVGEWVSASSFQNSSGVHGVGKKTSGAGRDGLLDIWREVVRDVSEQAEEILGGNTGRPVQVRYRLKQG